MPGRDTLADRLSLDLLAIPRGTGVVGSGLAGGWPGAGDLVGSRRGGGSCGSFAGLSGAGDFRGKSLFASRLGARVALGDGGILGRGEVGGWEIAGLADRPGAGASSLAAGGDAVGETDE